MNIVPSCIAIFCCFILALLILLVSLSQPFWNPDYLPHDALSFYDITYWSSRSMAPSLPLFLRIYAAAVEAVSPFQTVAKALHLTSSSLNIVTPNVSSPLIPLNNSTPIYILAFGKAAGNMTAAAEKVLGDRLKQGIAILPKKDEYSAKLRCRVFEASRDNTPDERSTTATREALKMIDGAEDDAVIVFLISGGGSALLSLPSEGITLHEKVANIKALQARAASIQQLNAVRRVLSKVKGGKLAERLKGRQAVSLILSDIVGDPLEFIASGPTVRPTSSLTALSVVDSLKMRNELESISPTIIKAIQNEDVNATNSIPVIPNIIVANNEFALNGMKHLLRGEGYQVEIVSSLVVGDALDFGRSLARLIQSKNVEELTKRANDIQKKFNSSNASMVLSGRKIALLFGGETTVELPEEKGIGGRSQTTALIALIKLIEGEKPVAVHYSLVVAGTDGQDGWSGGKEPAAGAAFNEKELQGDEEWKKRTREEGEKAIRRADSYNFWNTYRGGECHLRPGLSGSNVMDIAVVLIEFQ